MSADMLTDMVDLLTNVNQYWPRFGQHIDWQWADISTDGCLQYTIKIQEIYGELSNARILHGRIRYACILHGELSNACILHGELK